MPRVPQLAALLLASVTGLAACGPPSAEVLAAKYMSAPDAYEQLKVDAAQDLGDRLCLVIGSDLMAQADNTDAWTKFTLNPDGRWTQTGRSTDDLQLSQVLHTLGLATSRYAEYTDLLSRAGGERLTYCNAESYGHYAEVLVHRSGIVPAGCLANIRWDAISVAMTSGSGRDTQAITELAHDWRLVYECT